MKNCPQTNSPLDLVKDVLEVFPMPCFFKDREGRYQDCNTLFSKNILGLNKVDIFRKGITELFKEIPNDLAQHYMVQDNRLFKEEGLQVYESQVMCADTNRRLFRFIKSCVKNEEGEVIGLFGFMVDLEGHLSSTSLFQKDDKAMELGKKAATIVHEILNPLTVIQSILRIIQINSKDEESEKMIKIHSSATRALKSIDYIGGITKWVREMSYTADTGDLNLNKSEDYKECSLNQIIEQAMDIVKYQIINSGVELNFPSLEKTQNIQIMCQNTQLIQVIVNLLKNAKDAVLGYDEKWIRLSIEIEEDNIILKVIDSGEGVPVDIVDKIFDGGLTTKVKGEGSGIGLNLCKKIIESHSGNLYIDQEPENTTFVVSLTKL